MLCKLEDGRPREIVSRRTPNDMVFVILGATKFLCAAWMAKGVDTLKPSPVVWPLDTAVFSASDSLVYQTRFSLVPDTSLLLESPSSRYRTSKKTGPELATRGATSKWLAGQLTAAVAILVALGGWGLRATNNMHVI